MLFLLVMIIVALGLLCLSMMRSASEIGFGKSIWTSFNDWTLRIVYYEGS